MVVVNKGLTLVYELLIIEILETPEKESYSQLSRCNLAAWILVHFAFVLSNSRNLRILPAECLDKQISRCFNLHKIGVKIQPSQYVFCLSPLKKATVNNFGKEKPIFTHQTWTRCDIGWNISAITRTANVTNSITQRECARHGPWAGPFVSHLQCIRATPDGEISLQGRFVALIDALPFPCSVPTLAGVCLIEIIFFPFPVQITRSKKHSHAKMNDTQVHALLSDNLLINLYCSWSYSTLRCHKLIKEYKLP